MSDVVCKRLIVNNLLKLRVNTYQNLFKHRSYIYSNICDLSIRQRDRFYKYHINQRNYYANMKRGLLYSHTIIPSHFYSARSFSSSSCRIQNDIKVRHIEETICKKCKRSCSNKLNFFCGKCQYLKDPKMLELVSYFELFGFDINFDIDKKALDKCFYKLQHLFHPDRYVNKSDQALVDSSTEYSSFINIGYKTLTDDLERAKYILQIKGYRVLAEDENVSDTHFLEFIMEIREDIENSLSIINLEIHKTLIEEKKANLIKRISLSFSNEEYEDIKDLIIHLKYYNRILEAIDDKSREFH